MSKNSFKSQKANDLPSWTFLTNHSHVLVCLTSNPELRVRDLAEKVGITERAVQNILKDLEEASVIIRERMGRRNSYKISPKARLRHPVEAHCSVGSLLDLVTKS